MGYCPNCKAAYLEGITKCADCGVDLVPDIPEEREEELNQEELEIVYTCSKVYEAEMIKANLEGAGIEAFVLSQDDNNFPADGDFSVAKVLVHASDARAAIGFIESSKNTEFNNEDES